MGKDRQNIPQGRPAPKGRPAVPSPRPRTAAGGRTRVSGAATAPPGTPKKPGGPRKRKKVRTRTVVKEIFFNIMKAMFVMFCFAAIVVAVLAVQVVTYVVEATADDDIDLDLASYQLSQTSYIKVRDPDNPDKWINYQELAGNEHRIWVSLDKIPLHLRNAVISTEDKDFETHHGVDWKRTMAAFVNEIVPISDNQFGASTIHQQLVKNLTGEDEVVGEDGKRTAGYLRKMREIFSAWGLANNYSKDMVMEVYLNTIGLSEQIAGVQAGAREYFDKDVSDLTLVECATIAGITQAPTRYSPFQNPDNCLKRRNDVLTFMRRDEKITEQEYRDAVSQPLNLNPPPKTEETGNSDTFSYFSDVVFNEVVADLVEQKNISEDEAKRRIYTGGYTIYATADLKVQQAMEDMYEDGYEEYNAEAGTGYFLNPNKFPGYRRRLTQIREVKNEAGEVVAQEEVLPQSAAVVINYDGELVGVVGGIGKKEGSLTLNRAVGTVDENGNVVGTVRQVGSTMKMTAAYPLGIDYGIISYGSSRKDAPVRKEPGSKIRPDPATGFNWPANYGGGYSGSMVTVVHAIAKSLNTVAAGVGQDVGVDLMYDFLVNTLEVSSLDPVKDKDLSPLVLGGMTHGMSAYELAGCYMMYGNGGVFKSLHSYNRVEDANGNLVLEPTINEVQAISAETAYVLNRAMSAVLRTGAGTAYGMAIRGDMDSVAKTGTTSDDVDRWFVGLTPYYVTSVWWGYDTEFDMMNRWSANASTNPPPNVWRDLMERVQEGKEYKEFPGQPDAVGTVRTCTISGRIAGAYCRNTTTGYSTPQMVQQGVCTVCTQQTNQEDDAAQPPEPTEGGEEGGE